MNAIEIIKSRLPNGNNVQAELVYDPHPQNPREWDNLGTILIAPDKAHWIASPDGVIDTSIALGNNPYDHWENLRREQLKLKKSDIAIAYPVPVTKHEHGEISLSLGCKSGWECCVIGFVYVTKEQLRKCYGVHRITKSIIAQAKSCVQSELDMLADYLNGDRYGWQIKEYASTDDASTPEEASSVDECWGYLDKEQAFDDMQDRLNHLTKKPKNHMRRFKMELFVILSDNGTLRAGNTTRENLDKLKAKGFEHVRYSEDFLRALADDENAFFLPKNAHEIESLYDEHSVFSISWGEKEYILQAYTKTK